jgi:hypothetical protein
MSFISNYDISSYCDRSAYTAGAKCFKSGVMLVMVSRRDEVQIFMSARTVLYIYLVSSMINSFTNMLPN